MSLGFRCFFALGAAAAMAFAQNAPKGKQGNASAAQVYSTRCAFCHGADGSGDTTVGKNFKLRALASPEVQKMTDDQLFDLISKGKDKMPAFASLGNDTIHGLVAHIREFKKK